MRAWTSVLAAAVILWPAAPAAAQLPERGARSLQLSPGGSSRVGVWKMVSERTNLGVDVGVALGRGGSDDADVEDRTSWSLAVAPSLKRYAEPVGPFAPYLFASVPLGVQRQAFGDSGVQSGWSIGGALAAGLDWFPARGVSLGAHAGLAASHNLFGFDADGGPGVDAESDRFATFGSGLSLHIYF